MTHLSLASAAALHNWKTLHLGAHDTAHSVSLPIGPLLASLALWKARRAELIRREYEHGWPLGIWLAADETPAAVEQDLDDFTVIAIEFDIQDDGNAYFSARLLRERYGYRGELRILGNVPGNKLSFLRRLGFDTIADPGGRFVHALGNAADFGEARPRLVTAA